MDFRDSVCDFSFKSVIMEVKVDPVRHFFGSMHFSTNRSFLSQRWRSPAWISLFLVFFFLLLISFFLTDRAVYAQSVDEKNIVLSDLAETNFYSREEINAIAKEYGIDHSSEIEEIIYVPIVEPEEIRYVGVVEDPGKKSLNKAVFREIGKEEYYIKKKGSREKKGNLIQSSEFRYPSGEMTVSGKFSGSDTFHAETAGIEGGDEVVQAELTASYGFSVPGTDTFKDIRHVKVKKGCKREVRAYKNLLIYNYELWEDDPKYDDYCGKGTVRRTVGVIFTVSKNEKIGA